MKDIIERLNDDEMCMDAQSDAIREIQTLRQNLLQAMRNYIDAKTERDALLKLVERGDKIDKVASDVKFHLEIFKREIGLEDMIVPKWVNDCIDALNIVLESK